MPPLPERRNRFEDEDEDEDEELFDRRVPSPFERDAAPPVLAPDDDEDDYGRFSEPLRRSEREHAARTELLSGVDTGTDDPAERGSLRLSDPTVQVPVSGSLGQGLFAPPEPPIPSPKGGRPPQADETATQYLPKVAPPEPARTVEAPPEVADPSAGGWFQETAEGRAAKAAAAAAEQAAASKGDSSLVDDLDVDPDRRAASGELVDDVEELPGRGKSRDESREESRETGTIFTQRTQPVSGELIARLDGKAEERAEPAKAGKPEKRKKSTKGKAAPESEEDDEKGGSDSAFSSGQPTTVLPVRTPGVNRFDTGSLSTPSPPRPQPAPAEETQALPSVPAAAETQAMPSVPAAAESEPERPRSLFEPIVPADESATTTMPASGADNAAATRKGDGSVPPGPFGPGSAMPLPGGGAPSSEFKVKASVTALRYCEPDSPLFGRTVAEVWFRTTQDAERVALPPPGLT